MLYRRFVECRFSLCVGSQVQSKGPAIAFKWIDIQDRIVGFLITGFDQAPALSELGEGKTVETTLTVESFPAGAAAIVDDLCPAYAKKGIVARHHPF